MERAKARLHEEKTSKYNFHLMHKQAKQTPPVIDCATFSAPVEVRDSPVKGRGLLTTVPVVAGQLLLCEKAFRYYYAEEERGYDVGFNRTTKTLSVGEKARLHTQMVQKLYHGHRHSRDFGKLECRDYTPISVMEADGIPVGDSFQVHGVIEHNGFRSSQAVYPGAMRGDNGGRQAHATCGIWLMATHTSHSCMGNCSRSFIGDMQILHATAEMPVGTELFFAYQPFAMESYEDVQRVERWGLVNVVVPWAFLKLSEAYETLAPELCGQAKKYAEISYCIEVGEKETINDAFPEFA